MFVLVVFGLSGDVIGYRAGNLAGHIYVVSEKYNSNGQKSSDGHEEQDHCCDRSQKSTRKTRGDCAQWVYFEKIYILPLPRLDSSNSAHHQLRAV